eukprot:jgi/Tetstr1/438636/TSEL_027187.t1
MDEDEDGGDEDEGGEEDEGEGDEENVDADGSGNDKDRGPIDDASETIAPLRVAIAQSEWKQIQILGRLQKGTTRRYLIKGKKTTHTGRTYPHFTLTVLILLSSLFVNYMEGYQSAAEQGAAAMADEAMAADSTGAAAASTAANSQVLDGEGEGEANRIQWEAMESMLEQYEEAAPADEKAGD